MDDNTVLTFGKYKGVKLGEVPPSYLLWFYDNGSFGVNEALKTYIEENRETLEMQIKNYSKGIR